MLATLFGRGAIRRELRPLLESGQGGQYGGVRPIQRRSQANQAADGSSGGSIEEYEDDHSDAENVPPLLPLFEASQLDAIPVYDLTHVIRTVILPRCETTLSWDQLRSPQVSAFLVKPIQEEILREHFSRATLYALVANCLQFSKEATTYPGISGASRTRAMVCELLAIKLLKEYSSRELIDALSYDFYPLQGLAGEKNSGLVVLMGYLQRGSKEHPRAARTSTLEVAIRAQAKRFLGHPLVVQHLEAIWAGNIVFYSAADSLHRQSMDSNGHLSPQRADPGGSRPRAVTGAAYQPARRTVTLYDPQHASLFKLSRLRVPRYRQFFSTCSLLILLALFVMVLARRSTDLTPLEIVFWVWSAGFTLDEVVHFTEHGFNLHVLSFWNACDIGIFVILICYYCIRLVSLLATESDQDAIASIAYDLLAMDAILLFPRLFSILDHSRYFSQLLIAFRLMIVDLLAILALIAIACSGFFVAFTFSFDKEPFGGDSVAFALFQILMGFTPAAWDQWPRLNYLGQAALIAFLCITHFLVVTILITVLTNSFMAIVRNAHDEHQFVFAVNTITMVKSDALFSYVAPTNILAWLIAPIRYTMSFRRFVRMNRMIIKVTHFPILFGIFAYEKIFASGSVLVVDDDIHDPRPHKPKLAAFAQERSNGDPLARRNQLRREQSIATFQDRALEEVFRRQGPEETLPRPLRTLHGRKSSNAVNDWMHAMGPEGRASPPVEQDETELAHLERPRHRFMQRSSSEQHLAGGSDPEAFHDTRIRVPTNLRRAKAARKAPVEHPHGTDAEGDDELHSNEDAEAETEAGTEGRVSQQKLQPHLQWSTPSPFRSSATRRVDQASVLSGTSHGSARMNELNSWRPNRWSPLNRPHKRTASNTTILFNPLPEASESDRGHLSGLSPPQNTISDKRRQRGSRSPRQKQVSPQSAAKARPILPPRDSIMMQSNPNLGGLRPLDTPRHRIRRSSFALDLASDLGDNKPVGLPGAFPASFGTQFAWPNDRFANVGRRELVRPSTAHQVFAHNPMRPSRIPGLRSTENHPEEDNAADRLNRLVLVRMNTLEAGFREVLNEVKDWRRNAGSGQASNGSGSDSLAVSKTRKGKAAVALGKTNVNEENDMSDVHETIPEDGRL